MQWSDIPWRPTNRLLRQFAGLWIVFFGALAVLQWRHHVIIALGLGGLALIVGTLGLIRPAAIRPIFVIWIVLAYPIGWTVLNLCLAVVFYGLFTPLGLLFRGMGRDALELKRNSAKETYLQTKPAAPLSNYYRTF